MICSGGCQPSRWRLKTHFLTVPFGLGLEATAQMGFMLSRTRLDSGTTSASGQPLFFFFRGEGDRAIWRHQQLTAATVGLVSVHQVTH